MECHKGKLSLLKASLVVDVYLTSEILLNFREEFKHYWLLKMCLATCIIDVCLQRQYNSIYKTYGSLKRAFWKSVLQLKSIWSFCKWKVFFWKWNVFHVLFIILEQRADNCCDVCATGISEKVSLFDSSFCKGVISQVVELFHLNLHFSRYKYVFCLIGSPTF